MTQHFETAHIKTREGVKKKKVKQPSLQKIKHNEFHGIVQPFHGLAHKLFRPHKHRKKTQLLICLCLFCIVPLGPEAFIGCHYPALMNSVATGNGNKNVLFVQRINLVIYLVFVRSVNDSEAGINSLTDKWETVLNGLFP